MSELIKIEIDPGHGGSDRTNVGPNGYVEADGVLDISLRVKAKLQSTGQFDVQLTRESDVTVGLTERAKKAISHGARMFIANHTDAGSDTASGTTVFYSIDLPDNKGVAEDFSREISGALGITNRGSKIRESERYPGEDYYTVIDVAQDGGIPYVFIIESAFHSNPNEEKLLLDPQKRDDIAEAQARVICRTFGVEYKGSELINPQPVVESAPVQASNEPHEPAVNSSVLNLQKLLNRLGITDENGHKLVEDGLMGRMTRSAITKFQQIVGITVDGIAGTQTMSAINQILSCPLVRKGAKGLVVRYLQFKIGVWIDGVFGPNTEAAVKAWQSEHSLSADGIVGPHTWASMI